MTLAIGICATKNYTYAMRPQCNAIAANLEGVDAGHVILSGDESEELKAIAEYYRQVFPEGWQIHIVAHPNLDDTQKNYQRGAQLLIAKLRTSCTLAARKIGADYLWSLDSDVIPPANALRCMMDMIRFDDGYYQVSTCPYPNGAFLGGRGTPQNPICEDWSEEERVVPPRLELCLKTCRERLQKAPTPKEAARLQRLSKRLKECPPRGNVWELNAKHGWRKRGWLENAYPAIGKGAVVPSDWCGFGCTLMTRKAFLLCDWSGYDGQGTEDLWVCWKNWHPHGIRINVIPHCPCSHVIRNAKNGGSGYTYVRAYHEPNGECEGHLRTEHIDGGLTLSALM